MKPIKTEFDKPIPPELRVCVKGTWWLQEDEEVFRKLAKLCNDETDA
jgi:hypothetical protein